MPKFSLVETNAESVIKRNVPTGTRVRWEPDQPSSKEVGKNVGQQSLHKLQQITQIYNRDYTNSARPPK